MSPRTAKVGKKFPPQVLHHVVHIECQQMSHANRNGSSFSVEIFDAWHLQYSVSRLLTLGSLERAVCRDETRTVQIPPRLFETRWRNDMWNLAHSRSDRSVRSAEQATKAVGLDLATCFRR
jgi:hypothetical protein